MTVARRPLLLFARHELTLALRSRWTHVFAAVFAVLALAVASSGYILSGGHGVQDFARTASSLVQLVLLLTPLASLMLGVLALAPERGATELVYSQPVRRSVILLGRLLGLFEAIAAAQAVGFGIAGIVVFQQAGGEGLGGFFALVAGAFVLTAAFLGIAALISVGVPGRRARALAVALVVWFAAVVLFDVVALSAASVLRSGTASRVLIVSVLVNPVGAVRTGALLAIEGTAAFGAGSLALLRFTKGPVNAGLLIAASLVLWIVVPTILAARRLARADL